MNIKKKMITLMAITAFALGGSIIAPKSSDHSVKAQTLVNLDTWDTLVKPGPDDCKFAGTDCGSSVNPKNVKELKKL